MNIVTVAYPVPSQPFTLRPALSITDLAIHHTAGPIAQTPLEIDAFERSRGDIYMPYTWLIGPDGTIYSGRPAEAVSAATFGRNAESVAVCLIGDFQSNDAGYTGLPGDAQLDSLLELAIWAHRQYPAISRTYAHGQVAALFYGGDSNYATECCGDKLIALLPDIKSKVAAALNH